jgi:uncharacterized protein (TIGR02594 family)
MKYNEAILAAAGEYLGLQEWPGARHNPQIVDMFAKVGHGHVRDDETPWCAAFVGSVLAGLGLPHTGKLNARSYETYGTQVRMQDARPGDIVVLWRGSPASWQGHVAFFVCFNGDKIVLRGGNQGNAVTDASYGRDRVIAIRRADGADARGARPVLRSGDRGAWVLDLQDQLVKLGYTLGKKDGEFGPRTLAAVTAFQAENFLVVDGIVGDRTWAALKGAPARATRTVEMKDLQGKSRIVVAADKGKDVIVAGGVLAGTATTVSQVQDMVNTARQAEGLLSMIAGIAPSTLAIFAVVAVSVLAYRHFNQIAQLRLEDARTGANDRI